MGAVVARIALALLHRGEVHGLVFFALFGVSFVAPAGLSVEAIRAARTLVELPSLLLRGPVVLAVAVLLGVSLILTRVMFIAPANVP